MKIERSCGQAWKEGRTGYPWIDAIMMQLRQVAAPQAACRCITLRCCVALAGSLAASDSAWLGFLMAILGGRALEKLMHMRQEGHMHHLARHSVACFLTRGDLWVRSCPYSPSKDPWPSFPPYSPQSASPQEYALHAKSLPPLSNLINRPCLFSISLE